MDYRGKPGSKQRLAYDLNEAYHDRKREMDITFHFRCGLVCGIVCGVLFMSALLLASYV